jgi:hypothetical protein
MRFRLPHVVAGSLPPALLAAPAAHAFTVENKDAAGQYAVPKFDLEEQSKNFRKDGSGASTNSNAFTRRRLATASCSSASSRRSSNFGSVFARPRPAVSRKTRAGVRSPLAPPTSPGIQRVR